MCALRLVGQIRSQRSVMDYRSLLAQVQAAAGPCEVEAQDRVYAGAVAGKRQSQPKQDDMVSLADRPLHDAMSGEALLYDTPVDATPIFALRAAENIGNPLTGDLAAIDAIELGAGKPERSLFNALARIDETNMR